MIMAKRGDLVKVEEKQETPFTLFEKYDRRLGRTLKFDVNALADFEQETGMGFAQLMKQKAIFGTARAMLWAGLKHQDRALTIERVGDLIGAYLKDKDIPKDNRDINTLLEVAFSAAIDQGALGLERTDDPEAGQRAQEEQYQSTSGEVIDMNPN
jgi:hypothetical protein